MAEKRVIKLGELMGVLQGIEKIKLRFFDGNRSGKSHRDETLSWENAKKYADKEVFLIHDVTSTSAWITILEKR